MNRQLIVGIVVAFVVAFLGMLVFGQHHPKTGFVVIWYVLVASLVIGFLRQLQRRNNK
jgi:uncharacterized membrane protein